MAMIPIKKLNDGSTNYFPLGVPDSICFNKDIQVKNQIGGLTKGEVISKNTTFQSLIDKMISTEGPALITVDSELDDTSTNPVQNRVIADALYKKLDGSLSSEPDRKSTKIYHNGQEFYINKKESTLDNRLNKEVSVMTKFGTSTLASNFLLSLSVKDLGLETPADEGMKTVDFTSKRVCYDRTGTHTNTEENEIAIKGDINASNVLTAIRAMNTTQLNELKTILGIS